MRARLYVGALGAAFAFVLVHAVAVRAIGAESLYRLLGEGLYNALIAGGGLIRVVPLLMAFVALDVTLSVLRTLVRWPLSLLAGRLTPARQRVACHAGSLALLVAGVVAWPHLVTSSLGEHAIVLLLRVVSGGDRVEDTAYAPGFSERAFREIEPGMDRAQVRALLGEPVHVFDWGDDTWTACFATSPTGGNFWRRDVVFDRQDRVTEVRSGFWID